MIRRLVVSAVLGGDEGLAEGAASVTGVAVGRPADLPDARLRSRGEHPPRVGR